MRPSKLADHMTKKSRATFTAQFKLEAALLVCKNLKTTSPTELKSSIPPCARVQDPSSSPQENARKVK